MISTMDRFYLGFRSAAKKSRAVKFLFVLSCKMLRKDLYRKIRTELPQAIKAFVPEERKSDKTYIKKLKKAIIENGFLYSMNPSEYFLFGLESLRDEDKLRFVGDYEKGWLCQRLGRNEENLILKDKYETYRFFEPYFAREAVQIKSPDEAEKLFDFIKKHNGAIVKEACSSMGKQVTVVQNDPDDMNRYWGSISDTFQSGSTYIAEELIQQSAVMAAFHPRSVNTVRMMTFKAQNEVAFLGAFMRLGRGESVVDNAGSGGILAEVDVKTGVVMGEAMTESGMRFACHPDTGVRIEGFAIPRWDELLALSRNLANSFSKQKYVGWDLALTDNGWVLVEGNSRAQFINQYPNKNGMREAVRKYFYPELGLDKDY